MKSRTIDEKVIAERLNKFEGRHFRLLNSLASKNLEEKISTKSDLRKVNKELKRYFKSDNEYIKGVASAIYSKINHSIKKTRFSGANLGLVIEEGDIEVNYDIKDLDNFMRFLGVYNSKVFREESLGKTKILNSKIAENSAIKNSRFIYGLIVNNSEVANNSTINNSKVVYNSLMSNSEVANNSTISDNSEVANNSTISDNSDVANNSTIDKSSVAYISDVKDKSEVANNSKINNSNIAYLSSIEDNSKVAYNSTIEDSNIGESSTLSNNSSLAKNAKVKKSYIGEEATKDPSSSIAENIKYI